ncbi:hypothetical protein [Aeromonas salmonicida]|uniref:hypothetical protein n=1 Tax=Aeromonas salmonicida TaxID=645 RepID=UPI0024A8FD13|nr:hypothetical protein [Aeromonas salmonicida]MDM5137378.1 hypothetical protein [Aeromonas salmonicida]WHF39657.1 hypothetical protein QJ050_12705 [Aeromonas salmonicida]
MGIDFSFTYSDLTLFFIEYLTVEPEGAFANGFPLKKTISSFNTSSSSPMKACPLSPDSVISLFEDDEVDELEDACSPVDVVTDISSHAIIKSKENKRIKTCFIIYS